MPTDLTEACRAGQTAGAQAKCPHLFSSDNDLAFRAGQKIAGMSDVRTCFKSRGYSVRIQTKGGSTMKVLFSGEMLDTLTVDRT